MPKPPKLYLETYTEKNKAKKVILQYQYIKDEYKKPLYHGFYRRWDSTGSYLLVSGKYIYGQKDSLWIEYYTENRPKYEAFYENIVKNMMKMVLCKPKAHTRMVKKKVYSNFIILMAKSTR
jgi:hypothetical protein